MTTETTEIKTARKMEELVKSVSYLMDQVEESKELLNKQYWHAAQARIDYYAEVERLRDAGMLPKDFKAGDIPFANAHVEF